MSKKDQQPNSSRDPADVEVTVQSDSETAPATKPKLSQMVLVDIDSFN